MTDELKATLDQIAKTKLVLKKRKPRLKPSCLIGDKLGITLEVSSFIIGVYVVNDFEYNLDPQGEYDSRHLFS
jgi:hypothetical protein